MASAWRVVAFFLIVFVVPVVLITLPLYARYTLYPVRSMPLVVADTVDLHTMASSFWCQGQRMSSNGTFDAYLLPQAPKLNKKRRRVTTVTKILPISEEVPEARMVHLLRGSYFQLGVCSRWPGGQVIVVQGEKNFKSCFYKEDESLSEILENRMKNKGTHPERKRRKGVDTTTVRSNLKNALPISPIDVLEEAEEDAREIFDVRDGSVAPIDDVNTWVNIDATPNEVDAAVIKHVQDPASLAQKSGDRQPNFKNKAKSDINSSSSMRQPETYNGASNISEITKGVQPIDSKTYDNTVNSSKLLRVVRSIESKHEPQDDSDEKRKAEDEIAKKYFKLHSINDTRDVTAGNSSVSSSEEFMEHCVSTIVTADINVMVDCQAHDVSNGPLWSYRINETADYYFIFLSDNSLEENVMKYYLRLDRVMYNISDNKDTCSNSTECSFPLHFFGGEAVVVEMTGRNLTEEALTDLNPYEMQAICQPRVAVYMIFILLVPFIILLFAFQ